MKIKAKVDFSGPAFGNVKSGQVLDVDPVTANEMVAQGMGEIVEVKKQQAGGTEKPSSSQEAALVSQEASAKPQRKRARKKASRSSRSTRRSSNSDQN